MTTPTPAPEPMQPCQCGNLDGYISVHEWGHPYTRAWYVAVCRKCWMQSPRYFSRAEAVAWWNDLSTSCATIAELVATMKLVYRKHHLGDDRIGWDELSEKVLDTLSNAMGVEELVKWQEDDERE